MSVSNEPTLKRKLSWEDRAKAEVRAIDRQVAYEILLAIDNWRTTEQGDVIRLRPPRTGFRLRVGDWRVFFKAEPGENAIHITSVLHRSKAYRET
jgi:mRNA-degrading endonuclease RelE of RelBE toxin-antitoxin system